MRRKEWECPRRGGPSFDELELEPGDYLDVERQNNQLVLTPKQLVDKDFIRKRLEEAEADVKAGRTIGPFKTATEAIDALHSTKPR